MTKQTWTSIEEIWVWEAIVDEEEWRFRDKIVLRVWACGETKKIGSRIWMNRDGQRQDSELV